MTDYKYKKMIEINNDISELKKQLKEKESKLNEYKADFINEVGENEQRIFLNVILYYKNVCSKRLDTKKLKEENAKIYNKYLKETNSTRFYIKKI